MTRPHIDDVAGVACGATLIGGMIANLEQALHDAGVGDVWYIDSMAPSTGRSPAYSLNWQPKPSKDSPQQHPVQASTPPSGSGGKPARS